jgi:hypothetical protein
LATYPQDAHAHKPTEMVLESELVVWPQPARRQGKIRRNSGKRRGWSVPAHESIWTWTSTWTRRLGLLLIGQASKAGVRL